MVLISAECLIENSSGVVNRQLHDVSEVVVCRGGCSAESVENIILFDFQIQNIPEIVKIRKRLSNISPVPEDIVAVVEVEESNLVDFVLLSIFQAATETIMPF